MKKPAIAALMIMGMAFGTAQAGQQYVDESGFAASGYDVVAFFSLEQSPVGERQPPAVPGKASITADYNGAKWAFSSEQNRDMFVADPAKYAPAFDGHCAYGLAQGGKVPANPNLWRIIDGVLYLNITPKVVGFWEADIPGFIDTAGSNWKTAESKPASDRSWKSINDNQGTWSVDAPVSN